MINIYCDESCHLEHDQQKVMAIGGIACPNYAKFHIYEDIKKIKERHSIMTHQEIKWNKVSKGKQTYYEDLINYFFDNELLRFRGVLLPNKSVLRHNEFSQSHDDFYYKMYYYTISYFLNQEDDLEVYIDIKDTNSMKKIKKLEEVLYNKARNRSKEVTKIQQIRSHENSILQLTDLLLGAITYINRGIHTSSAKLQLCSLIKTRASQSLTETSSLSESKLNLLILDRL